VSVVKLVKFMRVARKFLGVKLFINADKTLL
jgi:hypothetical protein